MDALELAVRFADAVGIPRPTVLVASALDDERQILELMNQEGRSLSRRHDWEALTFETSFTTVATESQGALSSLLGGSRTLRRVINETIWDRTTQLPVPGPVSPRSWQAYKASLAAGPFPSYRVRGGNLLFNPAPSAGHTCYFEYVTDCWLTDSGGSTYRTNIAADTDVFLLDDEIMLAGLEWRWLRKKGLSYAEEFATYEGMVAEAMGSDATKPIVRMDGDGNRFRPGVLVPIGGWPL